MIGLETERLIFRQWQPSDYPMLAAFFESEENSRFVGGIKNPEAAWRLMASYIGHYHLHQYSLLAIEEKDNKTLIGTVGLWNSAPWPEPELGYWLLPTAQGKGFGVEAGTTVKQFALDELNFDSLVSHIAPANEPSKRLAIKLGAEYDKTINLFDFGPHEVYRYW